MTIRCRFLATTLALSTGVLIVACAEGGSEGAPESQAGEAAAILSGSDPVASGHDGSAGVAAAGVVLERVDGGGYTYTRLRAGEVELWAAGPEADVTVGDVVSLMGATPMENFPSKALDRTFDVLYFLGVYETPGSGGAPAEPSASTVSGAVLTVMHAAGYTYLLVDQNGASTWLAAPEAPVSEGDEVTWQGGTLMRGFSSRTLERTFDEILFVQGVQRVR